MGDTMGGGSKGGGAEASLALGLMNYANALEANKNARQLNASSNKWGPLLALNKSKGMGNVSVPSASFSKVMGPALVSAFQQYRGANAPNGGLQTAGANPLDGAYAGGQGEAAGAGASYLGDLGADATMFAAHGGTVPKYSLGGILPNINEGAMGLLDPGHFLHASDTADNTSTGSSVMKLLPLLAMMASKGGMVPGKEVVPGDNQANDKYPVMASAGEAIVPKSVMQNPNPSKLSHFIHAVKKNGPGPLPGKNDGKKPMATSMSPWAALCNGGMVR